MGKYKAKGGAMGGFMIGFIILIIAGGLIGLTVWLVMKNTPPATCDVSVSKVTVATTPPSGSTTYPVTIDYSGNGSNACANTQGVVFAVTMTYPDKSTEVLNAQQPVSQGVATVEATKASGKASVSYYVLNPDGSEGPHHTY